MAVSPNGRYLYAALEGPEVADSDQGRRFIYEFSVRRKAFTGRTWQYRTENAAYMISDMSMLDPHRIVVMERDDLVSLPAIHEGDVGLGDPFRVTCESVEAIYPLGRGRVVIGCDNNIPNTGRNPGIADDSEFILVKVPGLSSRR